jgi:WD40 repeat protein
MLMLLLLLAPAQPAPTYAQDVRPFFTRYCIECHTAQDPEGALVLETYESLMEGGKRGKAVVAGKPDEGSLVRMIEGKFKPVMPPRKSRQPNPEEVAKIRAWVLAGAKNDGLPSKITLPKIAPRTKLPTPVFAVATRPDGKHLAASGRGEVVVLTSAGDEVARHKVGRDRINALAYVKDALYAACSTAGEGHDVRSLPGGKILLSHSDTIQSLAVSPDGRWLASASYDRLIQLYDLVTAKPGPVLKDHSDAVYGVTFSPDGRFLASGGADRAVKVWEVATGQRLYTLGESTDWVYAVAWSPDGKHLAAAGVDKSIRVWEVNREGGKVVHSAFAHEGAVLRLAYSRDGKTLVSLGEDRVVKIWDAARMVETKVHPAQPEATLSLALSADEATVFLGRFDGVLTAVQTQTGQTLGELLPVKPLADRLPPTPEKEPNDSARAAQAIALPTTISGTLARPGDVDWFSFSAKAGQEIGVRIAPGDGKLLAPRLRLVNQAGELVAEGNDSLGYRVIQPGTYALGVWDAEYRGSDKTTYRLSVGPVPVITSVFPLGVPRGKTTPVRVDGVHLGDNRTVMLSPPADAVPGSRVPVKTAGAEASVVVGEFAETSTSGARIPVPGTANGSIDKPGSTNIWTFVAKKGQRLVLEVEAARLGSPLDSTLEILDDKGQPLPRAVLRSLARTYTTFRDVDSRNPGIRIETWSELAVNDLLLVGNELVKIRALPRNPDDDCQFFQESGRRLAYLGTTSTHQAQGSPMYKVSVHPPGTTFPPNGMPVVTLYWRNDDGPALDKDSRLIFDPPADGTYQIRIGDARGEGSSAHAYRLTVRPPRLDFRVSLAPGAPTVFPGSATPIQVNVTRVDAFDGPIDIEWKNLPPGLRLPATNIGPEDNSTSVALYAEPGFTLPEKPMPLLAVARAQIGGQVVERTTGGISPKLGKAPDIVTTTQEPEVTLRPGGETRLTVSITRQNGFTGRVPLDVRGLPHGVRVLDVGLNGILIIPGETKRTFVLYAEPWVKPTDHPIVVFARREGKPEEYAAPSVLLRIKK